MKDSISVLEIEFDSKVYKLTAIKKAAYRFADRCFVEIRTAGETTTQVQLQRKSDSVDLGLVAGEFRNEVLDQELREQIQIETDRVRNLLLAQAFSATSMVDPIGDTADFRDDPLGIAKSQVS